MGRRGGGDIEAIARRFFRAIFGGNSLEISQKFSSSLLSHLSSLIFVQISLLFPFSSLISHSKLICSYFGQLFSTFGDCMVFGEILGKSLDLSLILLDLSLLFDSGLDLGHLALASWLASRNSWRARQKSWVSFRVFLLRIFLLCRRGC